MVTAYQLLTLKSTNVMKILRDFIFLKLVKHAQLIAKHVHEA